MLSIYPDVLVTVSPFRVLKDAQLVGHAGKMMVSQSTGKFCVQSCTNNRREDLYSRITIIHLSVR